MAEYFEDYYDNEGNLHIDARKPKQKGEVKNFKFTPTFKTYDELKDNPQPKLVIHHCNIID